MPYTYPSHRIHEFVKAPKVVRDSEAFTVLNKGQCGTAFDVNLDLLDGAFVDLRYVGGAQDVAAPESYKSSLLIAGQRVRGVDFVPVSLRRFYRERIPAGWHQNVIDPNLPTDHEDANRHLALSDFSPTDFKDFIKLTAALWSIELTWEETML